MYTDSLQGIVWAFTYVLYVFTYVAFTYVYIVYAHTTYICIQGQIYPMVNKYAQAL